MSAGPEGARDERPAGGARDEPRAGGAQISATRVARRLGLKGWIQNNRDGSVEASVEGVPGENDLENNKGVFLAIFEK